MHPMLTIAVRAARKAGNIIARGFSELDLVKTATKSENDFVTNIDQEAEKAIIETIRQSYPDHSFVGEEGGLQTGKQSDYQWVIDPLDGTTNFIRGIPHFAVSIALHVKGKAEVAVVYDPIKDELFTAVKGKGARLDEYRIRVKDNKDTKGAIYATGFPFKARQYTEVHFNILSSLFETAADFRRCGSAALDLAYVAAGRYDGFWELGLSPWDIAAGELIVREAGGVVTDIAGGHNYLATGHIVAGNPKVTGATLKVIQPHLPASLKK
ncbi:inositol-1-monophosphatase [Saccharobesus litoralis]|uniref:Inositol-1-monophosphatase n=1 Tax=Saccharobesus litoralis TaxID=2172099 RepID=A0A2S0VTD9_9ALTE|nr:inositol-1-monophosphatase [Saccharobesus litoralis]AWB67475.1 inositol-1-monophosphatase [Saccharobesus litoralis]